MRLSRLRPSKVKTAGAAFPAEVIINRDGRVKSVVVARTRSVYYIACSELLVQLEFARAR